MPKYKNAKIPQKCKNATKIQECKNANQQKINLYNCMKYNSCMKYSEFDNKDNKHY